MVLDEENSILYLNNKNIKLNVNQSKILSFLIQNKEKFSRVENIAKYLYGELNYETRIQNIRCQIYTLNQRLESYFKIISKEGYGYKIQTKPYNKKWKKRFLEEHQDCLYLLNKYSELKEREKEVILLKKEIKTIEKNIF